MSGMTESAAVQRINRQCTGNCPTAMHQAIDLLKRANRYVGVHPSIGGQKLGTEITEFVAELARQERQA